jgi:hypothetical protein
MVANQVAGRYFVPWMANCGGEAFSINVNYDHYPVGVELRRHCRGHGQEPPAADRGHDGASRREVKRGKTKMVGAQGLGPQASSV